MCPSTVESPPCPTCTLCPDCPIQTTPTSPICPDCPELSQPLPCPTNAPCPKCPTFGPVASCPTAEKTPRSCLEHLERGNIQSSIYTIYIAGLGTDKEVFCDQETDGGGWIVIQRRKDGSEDFFRGWNDYKDGFGSLIDEFWLGLDTIHYLTSLERTELRIDLLNMENEQRYASYSKFIVGPEDGGYILTADGFIGNAGDSFGKGSGRHNGRPFSTKDIDNDEYPDSCANLYKGGWWYDSCHMSNLNGLYLRGPHDSYADGVNWRSWKGYHYSLKFTEMKTRLKTESPRSCLEHMIEGNVNSGVYSIYVPSLDIDIEVYCDQETDGGGWIVFQRRQDGTEDFYREWTDYVKGFGSRTGEFRLGLENIYHLSNANKFDLGIDLEDFENEERHAKYSTFIVGSEADKYVLSADGYTGDAGDSLGKESGRHYGSPFSTKDVDNDAYLDSCANLYKGGWWYDSCHVSNLNGLYLHGPHDSYADGVNWRSWKAYHYSLKFTEMKIREHIAD